jgi:hypothetical protein
MLEDRAAMRRIFTTLATHPASGSGSGSGGGEDDTGSGSGGGGGSDLRDVLKRRAARTTRSILLAGKLIAPVLGHAFVIATLRAAPESLPPATASATASASATVQSSHCQVSLEHVAAEIEISMALGHLKKREFDEVRGSGSGYFW